LIDEAGEPEYVHSTEESSGIQVAGCTLLRLDAPCCGWMHLGAAGFSLLWIED
jgi:hypothetical protein